MKHLVRVLTGTVMLLFFSVGAVAQISGVSTPPFTFDTTSPVPLSGMAIGLAILLILGFLIRHQMRAGKKAGV